MSGGQRSGAFDHVSPNFIEILGGLLRDLRRVVRTRDGQAFVVAGTGTLAMEMAIANVVEHDDPVVVVITGYFGVRLADIAERHGARVTRVSAPIGCAPDIGDVERAVRATKPKVIAVTHVDTSTAVLAPVQQIAALASKRGALTLVDAISSVGGEVLAMEDWGVDVVVAASQKALSAPAGLAIVVASPRALDAGRIRKTRVASYYADFARWLPIVQAYEAGRGNASATLPVELVEALAAKVAELLDDGLERRVSHHVRVAHAFRSAWSAMGLTMVPLPESAAHTVSALYYPRGVDDSLVARIEREGAVVATGLPSSVPAKYFRVGHMGKTSDDAVLATVRTIERSLRDVGHRSILADTMAVTREALARR